jgi:hypothetical protein
LGPLRDQLCTIISLRIGLPAATKRGRQSVADSATGMDEFPPFLGKIIKTTKFSSLAKSPMTKIVCANQISLSGSILGDFGTIWLLFQNVPDHTGCHSCVRTSSLQTLSKYIHSYSPEF